MKCVERRYHRCVTTRMPFGEGHSNEGVGSALGGDISCVYRYHDVNVFFIISCIQNNCYDDTHYEYQSS